jgi:L,D-peptidoglycan transpeptidase YkuD (ErfK/YbiS/YcfS/YnhG family)
MVARWALLAMLVVAACGGASAARTAGSPSVAGAVAPLAASTPAQRSPVARLSVVDGVDAGDATQLIVVAAVDPRDTWGQLQAFDRVGGAWVARFRPIPARLGRSGVSVHHREGDGTTPTGVYTITQAFGVGGSPGTRLPYRVAGPNDYWVSDPASALYNTWQVGPPAGRWARAEALWASPTAYRYAVVIDYNRHPVVAGRGSAIFLHVITAAATSGCVAVDRDRLVAIMRWLDPARHPRIAIIG